MRENQYNIKDINLADSGKKSIEKAIENMPVMEVISDRLEYQQSFANLKIALCSHITKETAVACIALKKAGADVIMVSSNPRSTQDDVAAALVKYYGISVFGHSQQTEEEWIEFREHIFSFMPDLLLDDGAEILPMIYEKCPELANNLMGSTEQTTSGVNKVINMDKGGILKHPVIAVNSSNIKHLFDNHFGVGQTGVTTILQLTNILVATECIVVVGYGPVGKGIANDMRGIGGHVVVCEIDPIRALEAYMDGFTVSNIESAAKVGTVFITATGSCDVIPIDVIQTMKLGAILSNCGSGQVEFDYEGIRRSAVSSEEVRPNMVKYTFQNGKYVYVLTEGRVTNLVGGEGNPAAVMDLSFAAITLAVEYLASNKLEAGMHVMPDSIDKAIALIKLNEFDIHLSKPTLKQMEYDKDWHK